VAGAWLAGKLIKPLGSYNIMLISAFALCLCALLTRLAGYVVVKRTGEEEREKDVEKLGTEGGFQLLLSDRYLMLIAHSHGAVEYCEPLRRLHRQQAGGGSCQ
jgi:ATP:ADP antiporter, AAA family